MECQICNVRTKIQLTKHIEEYNIFLISETWLTANKSFKLRGFDVVRTDRVGRTGDRVLIAVHNNIKYRRIIDFYNCDGKIEVCAVIIYINDKEFKLVSCYRPPNGDLITVLEWKRFFSQFVGKVIFGGDFNAHHEILGSSRTCRVGCNIAEALENLELTILNDGSPTFYCAAYRSNAIIDLTIVHDSLALRMEWSVGEDAWGSDHFPITIESHIIPD